MGLVDDGSSKSGFFSSIFSKPKDNPSIKDPATQDKVKDASALREFIKAPASSPLTSLFGRAKEVSYPNNIERPQINKTAIQKQAEHINAVRDSKLWAANNVSKPLGTSANEVHALKGKSESGNEPKTTAFFKIGSENESASGVMEEFMWKVANILGDAKQFVATSQTTVAMKDAAQPAEAAPNVNSNVESTTNSPNEKVEVKEANSLSPSPGEVKQARSSNTTNSNVTERRGGIQTAQNAITLGKYIDNPPGWKLAKSDILKASLTGMVYGMGDAHADNILIGTEGKNEITYFDNTRSLPPDNGYLDRGHGIVSSFRSGLMELPESYEPLSNDDVKQLKEQLGEYRAKFSSLKSFMNSPQTIHNLSTLPPGWMNREKTLNAMEERITRLEKALNSGESINLRDLAMAMSPQYKTAAAFEVLNRMIETKALLSFEKELKNVFNSGVSELSGKELNDMMKEFGIKGELDPKSTYNEISASMLINEMIIKYPPPSYDKMSFSSAQSLQKQALGSVGFRTMNRLLEICTKNGIDPSSINDLINDPFKTFDEIVMEIGVLVERDFGTDEKSVPPQLLRKMYSESTLDLKDIDREQAINETLEHISISLESEGVWDSNIEVLNESPPRMILRYEFNGQEQIHDLDYMTAPGKVIVQFKGKELPPMTASELKDWMEFRTMPRGAEGFQQLMAKFNELKIPLRALNPIEAIREARNLKSGEYFVAQERGASVPKLKVYLKNDKNQIESYDLKYNSKLELTVKLGTIQKSLSPEKLKELLTKSSK